MKNFIKTILLMGISLLLLIGCSSKKQEETIDNFINKLISVKTYEKFTFLDDEHKDEEDSKASLEKYEEDSKASFGEYLTEDAFNTLMANRVPYFYYTVINKNNVKDITDIKIEKTKETKNDTYIHYEYKVSYKLKSDDKSIDMTDYMSFKLMKDNTSIIDEVYILDKTSSIFSEYRNVSQ